MLSVYNKYYLEPLLENELSFLKQKADRQERLYSRILRFMLLGALVFSFGGAWKNVRKEGMAYETITIFSWENYFITLLILCILFYLAIRVARSRDVVRLKMDIRKKTKIIERTLISRKTFLPHNNTFHFYLNSRHKLSIEVAREDFEQFTEGDEINIEYSAHAGIYFGYF